MRFNQLGILTTWFLDFLSKLVSATRGHSMNPPMRTMCAYQLFNKTKLNSIFLDIPMTSNRNCLSLNLHHSIISVDYEPSLYLEWKSIPKSVVCLVQPSCRISFGSILLEIFLFNWEPKEEKENRNSLIDCLMVDIVRFAVIIIIVSVITSYVFECPSNQPRHISNSKSHKFSSSRFCVLFVTPATKDNHCCAMRD